MSSFSSFATSVKESLNEMVKSLLNPFDPMAVTLDEVLLANAMSGPKELVTAPHDMTVEKALDVLNQYGIGCLPVKSKKDKFVGIINLLDLVSHLSDTDEFTKENCAELLKTPIIELLGLSDESKTLPVFEGADRLDAVLKYFVMGYHRALVFSDASKVQGGGPSGDRHYRWHILSQSDVVRFLASHAEQEGGLPKPLVKILDLNMKELGLVRQDPEKQIVSISMNSSTITAFRTMAEQGVTCLPILDNRGKLCGTLSSSDMIGMSKDKLGSLKLTVQEFLQVAHLTQSQVTVLPTATLGQALSLLSERDVHRAWIVENEDSLRVVGVISLSDIISYFVPEQTSPAQHSRFFWSARDVFNKERRASQSQTQSQGQGQGLGLSEKGDVKTKDAGQEPIAKYESSSASAPAGTKLTAGSTSGKDQQLSSQEQQSTQGQDKGEINAELAKLAEKFPLHSEQEHEEELRQLQRHEEMEQRENV